MLSGDAGTVKVAWGVEVGVGIPLDWLLLGAIGDILDSDCPAGVDSVETIGFCGVLVVSTIGGRENV